MSYVSDEQGYTIIGGVYASVDLKSAVVETAEHGAVAISAADRPALWAQMLELLASGAIEVGDFVPEPEAPPPPTPLEKLQNFLVHNPDVAAVLGITDDGTASHAEV